MLLLDIRNAFNTVNWQVIISASEKNIPLLSYPIRMIGNTNESISEQEFPMDSVLWNLTHDGELVLPGLPGEVEHVAYVDDLALLVTAMKKSMLNVATLDNFGHDYD